MKTYTSCILLVSTTLSICIISYYSSVQPVQNKTSIERQVFNDETSNERQVLNDETSNERQVLNEACPVEIPILIQLINSETNEKLRHNFNKLLYSIISQTNCKLKFYIICDSYGMMVVKEYVRNMKVKFKPKMVSLMFYDINDVTKKLENVIHSMQSLFVDGQSYYNKPLFVIPASLHRILDHNISRLIMLDTDLLLETDINHLFMLFQKMSSNQLMGLAREQQPVYWHVLSEFREYRSNVMIGGPPPTGITGFNSGVKLMNLHAMRKNKLYNKYLDDSNKLSRLAKKYYFKGHLGDQDFFTLLSFDFQNLFYILPCGWNRQLCEWWRYHGYADIFELYFKCDPPYFILHGNCGTEII